MYKNQEDHDPSNIHRAREYASMHDKLALGILYRNENVPCYDDIRRPKRIFTAELKQAALEREFDKFGVSPVTSEKGENSESID